MTLPVLSDDIVEARVDGVDRDQDESPVAAVFSTVIHVVKTARRESACESLAQVRHSVTLTLITKSQISTFFARGVRRLCVLPR